MSRTIPLTRGYFTIVDDEDFEWLSQWKWLAQGPADGRIYAARDANENGRKRRILMHRQILGTVDAAFHVKTDHVNNDSLDNRRQNLRTCTNLQNSGNYGAFKERAGKPVSSRYRGVSFYKRNGYWTAQINVHGKKRHLGCFPTQEDAARARDVASRKHFGEFAFLNFPD